MHIGENLREDPQSAKRSRRDTWPVVIDAYVASLGAALRGPRAVKRELLTEVRDSLNDAAAGYEADGLPTADAARAAVADFGAVDVIAPDYQRELALAQGRRTALLVALGVGIQGPIAELVWRSAADGWTWRPSPGYLLLSQIVDYTGYAVLGGGLMAALLCGIGSRYLDVGSRFVRTTGIATITVCVFFMVGGGALSLLSPTMEGFTPLSVFSTVLSAALPLWMVSSGLRCLRVSLRRPLRASL